jgi:replicative DNA helicase
MERELLELVLLMPAYVQNMHEVIRPEDLRTSSARELYQLAIDLHASGTIPEFGHIMNTLENESLKSLLVDLDERATTMAKAVEPEERLRVFLEKCTRESLDRHQGSMIRRLRDDPQHDDAELLLKILEQEKLKRGIS